MSPSTNCHKLTVLIVTAAFAGALGCGDKTVPGAAASASSASAAVPVKTAVPPAVASTAPKEAEAPKAVELADIDLGSADPKWKGWTVRGPADSKVLEDGMHGARIAGAKGKSMLSRKDGDDTGIDIAFAWGKQDLAKYKTALEKGASMSDGKSVYTFLTSTADTLEYKSTYNNKSNSYGFAIHMKVGKVDVTCKSLPMGAGNEAELKRMTETCKTLAQKK